MMNYQPQHIQKREIVDIQKTKYKHKSSKKTLSNSSQSKTLYKDSCYSSTELNADNNNISPWTRDFLDVKSKYQEKKDFFFVSFVAFQLPSPHILSILSI